MNISHLRQPQLRSSKQLIGGCSKKARSFLSTYATGKPYKLVHFGATPIARETFSPMKHSSLKNDESDVILSGKNAESIHYYENSQSAIPPSLQKKRLLVRVTKESPKLVTPEERDWMEFINTHQWSKNHLSPPET